MSEKRESFLNLRFIAYSELFEICHRAKVVADDCLKQGELPYPKVEEFEELVNQLTEKLLYYRLYIPSVVWETLHETKHNCQYLLIRLNILSRIKGDNPIIEKTHSDADWASKALSSKIDRLERLLKININDQIKVNG